MRVIVLGLGAMGAATANQLSRRGIEVTGFDQFQPPHTQGSHHGESRMIRQAYYEHPNYVPLLFRAYELWQELEERRGKKFLTETGGLYLAPQNSNIISGSLRSSQEHGISHELFDHGTLQSRFPQFIIPDHFVGFFEKHAGFLRPEMIIDAFLSEAREHGAHLITETKVDTWQEKATGVQVIANDTTYEADHLVITAGAWSKRCLEDLHVPLSVTRQLSAWFEPSGRIEKFSASQFPSWFIETDPPHGYYGFPASEDGTLKIAMHRPGQVSDPDDLSPPTKEEKEPFIHFLGEYLPGATGSLKSVQACRYTNSPDGHFILGPHPGHTHVTMAAGFSGHGFKFSSVLGEALADLAVGEEPTPPLAFLSPTRFSQE